MCYVREGAMITAGTLASYFYGIARYGPGPRAGAIAFNSLILGQLLHALSCRPERRGILSASQVGRNNSLNLAPLAGMGYRHLRTAPVNALLQQQFPCALLLPGGRPYLSATFPVRSMHGHSSPCP
jgi:hypothetical protein